MKNETKQIISDNSNEKLAIKVDLNVKIVKDNTTSIKFIPCFLITHN